MSNTVINTQADFKRAFSMSTGDLQLAPGTYNLPVPEDADKIYMFNGSIVGTGDSPDDVILIGKVGTNDHLILKNLTMCNADYPDSVIAFNNSVLLLRDVKMTRQGSFDAEECYPLRCDANAKLVMDNVTVNYSSWGRIRCYEGVQANISNSKLQGLFLYNGGNMSLVDVSAGDVLVDGWDVAATNLQLYDHPGDKGHVSFGPKSEWYEKLKGKKWLLYIGNHGALTVKNLKLPDKLSDGVSPLGMFSGQIIGNIADPAQYEYHPWVDANEGKVALAGADQRNLFQDSDHQSDHEAVAELQQLIGLATVKKQVTEFIQMALMNKRRKQAGLTPISNSFHSLFEGNPGTGKTTVARLVGRIMHEEGILPTSKYVEVDRGDLVAGYVGQTTTKTKKILEKATGGVLFIDEAYDLVHGSDDSFGLEALDCIMKYMEDNRDKLMIIFAGYTDDMEKLLQQNPGMKSRVPNVFNFEDYSAADIAAIGRLQLRGKQMQFDQPSTEALYNQLIQEHYENSNDHSNGRWIRNQNDLLLRQIAVAISQNPDHPLDQVWADDITRAFSGDGLSDGSRTAGKGATSDSQPTAPLPPLNDDPLPFLTGDELK